MPDAEGRACEPVVRDLALWDRIRALPPRQRTVIVLRYYEDMSEAQIAALMGSSVGTVKSQASRAVSTLSRDAAALAGEQIGVGRTATPAPERRVHGPQTLSRAAARRPHPSIKDLVMLETSVVVSIQLSSTRHHFSDVLGRQISTARLAIRTHRR